MGASERPGNLHGVMATPILGKSQATVQQARRWALRHGATPLFVKLADLYWDVFPVVGVVAEAGYVQAAHETGFGHFGGVLDASFKNPCGLKITSGGGNHDRQAHKRFSTWRGGVVAHRDHLALYAGAPGYPKRVTPDPRHFSWLLGDASTLEELGNKWNDGNADYGFLLARNVAELRKPIAAPARPSYVRRRGWGAEAPKHPPVRMEGTPRGIFVHYSGANSDEQADHANCAARVHGIQAFHQGPSRNWNDIAYSFLVCKHGTVFEGRGWGIVGAHTLGYNLTHHAVCFLGDDTKGRDDVTAAGRDALEWVIAEAMKRGGDEVLPHSARVATECPGDQLREWVRVNYH